MELLNTSNNSNGNKLISKRIFSELTKCDINESQQQMINELSYKLDYLVDVILNKCENKFHCVQLFICNIVEINSELIRILPEYKNFTDDINLRFIIPSKNIYNFAIEIYFSLNDLYNIDINTFMDVFKMKYPFKYDDKYHTLIKYRKVCAFFL